ncbi:Dye-decolorizing peroxidase [hydrothermal vent metagenome]|uniref:Dye-decolorizing peroxidase n=1 Tax=hydrothermal vent metagenome TaxID=652676 RepID=A0A3B0YB71_9ZZZZ
MKSAADLRENLDDIQGNILKAYKYPHAVYCFWSVTAESGRLFLQRLLDIGISSASVWPVNSITGESTKPAATLNCALTYKGLEALEVDVSRLELLPETFRAGMSARSIPLGDIGGSAPEHWQPQLDDSAIHVMVVIYAMNKAERESQQAKVRQAAQATDVIEVAHAIEADALPNSKEHFGFVDGIGQPSIEGGLVDEPGMGTPNIEGWQALKPGEFIHGYIAEREKPPLEEKLMSLIDNGTYLVLRQLQQDVAEFRSLLKTQAMNAFGSDSPVAQTRLASNLVGRWPSGASLMASPIEDPGNSDNDFRYSGDPDGMRCPLGAHIRRCNPRDGLAADTHVPFHRILRRGLPYGPLYDEEPEAERGLVFIAINTDIEAQFEFVQEQWMQKGDFVNLSVDEKDPLAGVNSDGRFTLPGGTQNPVIFGINTFVQTRGGGYFFMPSIKVLDLLANGKL